MLKLTDVVENSTVKDLIEEDPKLIKVRVDAGMLVLDYKATIFLNRKYLNQTNLKVKLTYTCGDVFTYTIATQQGDITGKELLNKEYKNSSNQELHVLLFCLRKIRDKVPGNIISLNIKCNSRNVLDMMNRTRKNFNIYSTEFKLFFKIKKLIKSLNCTINYENGYI